MFTTIGMFFETLTEALMSLRNLARTGRKYTEHFETDADIKLNAMKAKLAEDKSLNE